MGIFTRVSPLALKFVVKETLLVATTRLAMSPIRLLAPAFTELKIPTFHWVALANPSPLNTALAWKRLTPMVVTKSSITATSKLLNEDSKSWLAKPPLPEVAVPSPIWSKIIPTAWAEFVLQKKQTYLIQRWLGICCVLFV
jgi:Fe-S cluster biosynthesis and repair protein YggX